MQTSLTDIMLTESEHCSVIEKDTVSKDSRITRIRRLMPAAEKKQGSYFGALW